MSTASIAAPAPSAAPRPALTLAERIAWVVAIAFVTRAAMVLIGLLALVVFARGEFFSTETLVGLGVHWDAGWYLSIVEGGYSQDWPDTQVGATNFAFFPVYPLLVRAAVLATGLSAPVAGIMVSNLLFLGALLLAMLWVEDLGYPPEVERAVVVVLCTVPGGYVFSVVYTESTFLFLLLLAVWATRRERFWLAALAAATLSATRSIGLFFAVWAAVHLVHRHGRGVIDAIAENPRRLLPVVFAPLGLVLYWWWCWYAAGDAFAQVHTAARGWGWTLGLPGRSLLLAFRSGEINNIFFAVSSLVAAAMVPGLVAMRRWEEAAFAAVCLLLYWSGATANSLLRYALVVVPLHLPIAVLAERRPMIFATVVGLFALLGGFLTVAWALGKNITI